MADAAPTREMVADRITQIDTLTTSFITDMNTFFQALQDSLAINIPYINPAPHSDIDLAAVDVAVDPPADITAEIESAIAAIDFDGIGTINTSLTLLGDMPTIPDFTEDPPTIVDPTPPAAFNESAPTPVTPDTVTTPDAPTYSLPNVPSMNSYVLPVSPTLEEYVFDGVFPTFNVVFDVDPLDWSEAAYTSALLDLVRGKLTDDLTNGGTGLGDAYETALWQRQTERDEIALEDAIDQTIETWASRGLNLVDGALAANEAELRAKYLLTLQDRNREITTKQAELALENRKFSMTTSVQLEQMWIAHVDNVAERALKAAISTIETGIAIYNAQVAAYNSQLEAYKTKAQVFETLIRAELAKVELYKAQLEGVKALISIDTAKIELYKAQLQGVLAVLEVYKTEMEGANIRMQIQKLRIDTYKTQVDAFSAKVQAKVAEYQMYKAAWDGELAKVQVFDSQVKAYTSQVESLKISGELLIEEARAEIETKKAQTEQVKANLEVKKSEAEIAIEKIKTLLGMYQANVTTYNAEIQKAVEEERLKLESAKLIEMNAENNVKMAMESANANLQAFVHVANIEMEAAKGGSQIYSSLVSAAMQAIHASMGISAGYGHQYSDSVSYGYSGEVSGTVAAKTSSE